MKEKANGEDAVWMGLHTAITKILGHSSQGEQLSGTLRERLNEIKNYIPTVGIFGVTGAGKSSLLNALFGKDVAETSDVQACTREEQEVFIGDSEGNGRGIRLIDFPGIGEDIKRQEEYSALYKEKVSQLDLVLWAIKSDDRAYASALETYRSVFLDNESLPVIFVVTQADKIEPFKEWDVEAKKPGVKQLENLSKKILDISETFVVPKERVIPVSVNEEYNLKELVNLVVEVVPKEKKYSFVREAKKDVTTPEAISAAETGIWDTVIELFGDVWEKVKEPVIAVLTTKFVQFLKWW